MKLELNKIYIVRTTYGRPTKIKVLEVTNSSYYIHNLDADSKYRILIKEFDRSSVIDEEMGGEEINGTLVGHTLIFNASNKPDHVSWNDIMQTIKGYKIIKL